MSDNLLDKYTRPKSDDASINDNDGTDDFGAFGWLRGVRDRSLMLELRHRDGRITAFGYAWLDRAEFDPSEGITLHFAGRMVKITGRNLNAESKSQVRLLAGILRQRVPWVQETDRPTAMELLGTHVVIEGLNVIG